MGQHCHIPSGELVTMPTGLPTQSKGVSFELIIKPYWKAIFGHLIPRTEYIFRTRYHGDEDYLIDLARREMTKAGKNLCIANRYLKDFIPTQASCPRLYEEARGTRSQQQFNIGGSMSTSADAIFAQPLPPATLPESTSIGMKLGSS